MQQALSATGHPIVLSVEGWEDVRVLSKGGHGQTKRVGHDISPSWGSMISLVDIGSGLWPFAVRMRTPLRWVSTTCSVAC